MSFYNQGQVPDTAEGDYFVSARDCDETFLILGPFTNDHAAALAAVEETRRFAVKKVDRAFWYSWGTVRLPFGSGKTGSANKHLPHLLTAEAAK